MSDPSRAHQRGRFSDVQIAIGLFLHSYPSPILIVFGVLAPALGAFFMTLGQDRADRGDWAYLLSGFAAIVVGGLVLWAKQRASEEVANLDMKVADRFRITIKDALQPVAELIADMPAQTRTVRRESIKTVSTQAVSALRLLLKDVSRLRATVYQINADGDMECVCYHGRGNSVQPQPFIRTTLRGERALEFVRRGGEPLFIRDIDKVNEGDVDYRGTRSGYKTFISASIHNDADGYGMVTIDAPRAGSLVDTDKQLVALVADLLAIAFAIAEH